MTTDNIQEYIRLTFVNHLERLMGHEAEGYYWRGQVPEKNREYVRVLHEMMVPYYTQYLNGDTPLCKPNMEAIRWEMKRIIEDDSLFGEWASEQDLIIAAEGWGGNMKRIPEEKRIYQYFHVLEVLLKSGCRKDWRELSATLKAKLFMAEEYSDYKTDELYCILHAFTMIMQQEWTLEKKEQQLELLRQNWLFMKYYYSVMTRHIVGVKWTDFYDVTKTVLKSSQSFKPHMHIYYCGLMEIVDELNMDSKHRRKMDDLILKMQNEVNRTEPSDMLYGLCDLLFPEEFYRLLREHRPKTYKEVENENQQKDELINQLKTQTKHLQSELERTTETLRQMIESSIPIEEIERELLNLQVGVDYAVFIQLTGMLIGNVAWMKAAPAIKQRILARQAQPTVSIQNQFGPVNGNIAQQTIPLPPFEPTPRQIASK